jgi:thiamine-phosphate pyrophosphorylase
MSKFLSSVLHGGVDIVQLREKNLDDELRIKTAKIMVPICRDYGVPFIMNDSPELALEVGADGVHVGQDDVDVARCRELLGPDAIIGLSTHSTDEFTQGLTTDATYLSAGPIVATPTKPGRAPTGISYALECQARSDRPVFVTGGVDANNIFDLAVAGLHNFVVVRALTESSDPETAASEMKEELTRVFGS